MLKIAAATLVLVLSGCATSQPSGPYWEERTYLKHSKVEVVFIDRGWSLYCVPGSWACAQIHDKADRCLIFVNKARVPENLVQTVIRHEKCHCLGFDHPKHMRSGDLSQECPVRPDLHVAEVS